MALSFAAMNFPLGRQDFRTLRRDGLRYVDKTEHLARVMGINKYLFLARPRRFGKSLSVTTLKELHSGDRELFDGLWAHEHWDFAAAHSTVIHLELSGLGYDALGVDAALRDFVHRTARRLGLSGHLSGARDLQAQFAALLEAAAAASPSGQVALLVDEYDKPIVDYLDDPDRAEAHRDELKRFYAVLKGADAFLRLVFITGVSAFGKVSVFSDLNNVTDLSLHPAAATLVGITERELDDNFAAELRAAALPRERVRRWYNGYRFATAPTTERVYNPWSLLSFLSSGELASHWFETGTPTWLTRLVLRGGAYPLTGVRVKRENLTAFDLRAIDPVAVLFQTGYLTIAAFDSEANVLALDYPNLEVRQAFESQLLRLLSPASSASSLSQDLLYALRDGRIDRVAEIVDAALAGVPYPIWGHHPREAIFHMVVHLLLSASGALAQSEVSSRRGRADVVAEAGQRIYCFEFKRGVPARRAVQQILERGYLDPYAHRGLRRVAVGMTFDAERRRLREWASEELP